MARFMCYWDIGLSVSRRCGQPAEYYFVAGCMNMHVTETATCEPHGWEWRKEVPLHGVGCTICQGAIVDYEVEYVRNIK